MPEYKLKYKKVYQNREGKRERERNREHFMWMFLMKSLRERIHPPHFNGVNPQAVLRWYPSNIIQVISRARA
jgi:hypothetical protein